MGTSTAVAIATMNAANMAAMNNHQHCHEHSPNEGAMLASVVISFCLLPVLWIVFTSIRQLIKRDKYYDFREENDIALITLAVMGGLVGFFLLCNAVYVLIK